MDLVPPLESSTSDKMPNPFDQFDATQGATRNPFDQFGPAGNSFTPGSPEAIQGIESGGIDALHKVGVAARPWGPLAAATSLGATAGGALGIPAGPAGMLALGGTGATVGAGAYGLAHLLDLPVMGFNYLAGTDFRGPGGWFDDRVNKNINPLPEPVTTADKYIAATSEGVQSAIAGNKAGAVMKFAEEPQALRPVFQSLGDAFTQAPVKNAVLGGVSGAGGEAGAQASNDSPQGRIAGALLPVFAAGAGEAGLRAAGNAIGRSNINAYARGFMGRGEQPGAFFGGARQEVMNDLANRTVAADVQNLADQGGSIPAAVDSLTQAGNLKTGGFVPTSGPASENQGLIMMEQGMKSDPAVAATYKGNKQAISQSVADTLAPKGASPAEAQGFFSRLLSNMQSSADRNAQRFEDIDLNRAESAQAQNQAAVTANRPTAQLEEAGIGANTEASGMMAKEQAAYKAAYQAVDPSTPVSFGSTIKAGIQAIKSSGKNADIPPKIKQIIETRAAKPMDNFSEMQSDRAVVNSEISKAQRIGDNNSVRMLMEIKNGIDADLLAAGSSNAALKAANAKFSEFQNRWSNGAAGNALDEASPASQTLTKYMANREGAIQYRDTIGATPAGKQEVEKYLTSRVAQAAGANPTKESMLKAINSVQGLTESAGLPSVFPEIRQKLIDQANKLGASSKFVEKQTGVLKGMQADAAAAADEATGSLAGKFAQGSEQNAISQVQGAFSSGDPLGALSKLAKQAKMDKTGASYEGLQNAVRKALADRLFNKGSAVTSSNVASEISSADLPTSMAGMASVIKGDGKIFESVRGILPPDEIKSLQENYRKLEMMSRMRSQTSASGYSTADDEAAKKLLEMANKTYTNNPLFRDFKSASGFFNLALALAKKSVVKDGVIEKINDLKREAILDPEKMKQLLLRPTPQNYEKTKWVRQQLNIIAQAANQSPDEQSPKTPVPKAQGGAKATPAPANPTPSLTPGGKFRYNSQTGTLEQVK